MGVVRTYLIYVKVFFKSRSEYRMGFFLGILANFYSYFLVDLQVSNSREEQMILRREYIDSFKANLRAQLENIEIVDAEN